MSMLRWIRDWWYARQRAFDLKYLWPSCCEQAKNIEEARMAFAMHALMDKPWLHLGDKLQDTINALEPPP